MSKPTQEQIEKFWKRCGLKEQPTGSWYTDDGQFVYVEAPPIDLEHIGFLFKYAVPKPRELGYMLNLSSGMLVSNTTVTLYKSKNDTYQGFSDDPALALFWALCITPWGLVSLVHCKLNNITSPLNRLSRSPPA